MNFLAGWLLGYGLLLFEILQDPMSLYSNESERGFAPGSEESVLPMLFFATLSIASFTIWAKPYVRTSPEEMTVCNPLTLWVIPLSAARTIEEGFMFPRVVVDGSSVLLWGLERSLLDTVRGHAPAPNLADGTDTFDVSPKVRYFLSFPQLLLVALWILYPATGLVR